MQYARVSVNVYLRVGGRGETVDGRAMRGARGGSNEHNNNNIIIIQIITIIILFYYFESDLHADEPSSDVAAVMMSASGHFSARFNANRTSVTALRKCLHTCTLKRAHLLPQCPVLVVDYDGRV